MATMYPSLRSDLGVITLGECYNQKQTAFRVLIFIITERKKNFTRLFKELTDIPSLIGTKRVCKPVFIITSWKNKKLSLGGLQIYS